MGDRLHITPKILASSGTMIGLTVAEDGVYLTPGVTKGIYVSDVIDVGEKKHRWQNMKLLNLKRRDIKLKTYVLAYDKPHQIEFHEINEMITVASVESALSEWEAFGGMMFEETPYGLLHMQEGQYLKYIIVVYGHTEDSLVSGIEIQYIDDSWVSYLPEIYQNNGAFLSKFLAVFKEPFDELEHFVDRLPALYMPDRTDARFLSVINKWLQIKGFNYWPEEVKRALIANYANLNRLRGTRSGLALLLKILLPFDAYIIEYQSMKHQKDNSELNILYQSLYVDDPYGLTLVMMHHQSVDKEAIWETIEDFVPVQTKLKIVYAGEKMLLGEHVYLGMNTKLVGQKSISLDDQSMLSMGVISR